MAEPNASHCRPLRVAVIGDSRATNYACHDSVEPFPEVLAELSDGGVEVRNFAQIASRLDKYLSELDEVLEWRPDVVVSVFGGRESMYRMSRRLKRFPCNPRTPVKAQGWGWLLPLAWLRRQAWRSIVHLLVHYPAVGEPTMRLLRAHPYRTADQYRASLITLFDRLAPSQTQAVLMQPFPSIMGEHPWCPSLKSRNGETGRALAKELPETVSIWDPKRDVDFTSLFLDDGVHLTEEGHRVIAQSLLEVISKAPRTKTRDEQLA